MENSKETREQLFEMKGILEMTKDVILYKKVLSCLNIKNAISEQHPLLNVVKKRGKKTQSAPVNLNDDYKLILEYIKEQNEISFKKIFEFSKLPKGTISSILNKLVEDGTLIRPSRGNYKLAGQIKPNELIANTDTQLTKYLEEKKTVTIESIVRIFKKNYNHVYYLFNKMVKNGEMQKVEKGCFRYLGKKA